MVDAPVSMLAGDIVTDENGALVTIVVIIPVERLSIAVKELVYIVTENEVVGLKLMGLTNPTIVSGKLVIASLLIDELTILVTLMVLVATTEQVTGILTDT